MQADCYKILVYGYGNPGRQDDGLGVRFVEWLNKWLNDEEIYNIDTDSNYQLNIEDAVNLNQYEQVFFVDASQERDIEHYSITPVIPNDKVNFTMHASSPAYIVHVCQGLYNTFPDTRLIHIKGYEWEFMKDMTINARKNLELCFKHFLQLLKSERLIPTASELKY